MKEEPVPVANLKAIPIVLRLFAAVGGGYVAATGLAALTSVALATVTSMQRSEAVVLSSMLAFLVYLALLIWGFAERRLTRLLIVFAVVGGASWASAWTVVRLSAAD